MKTIEKEYELPSAGLFEGPTKVTIRPMSTLEEKLKISGIPGITRAQELSKEDWKKLAKIFL